MPAIRPRITFTPEDDTLAAVDRLAARRGVHRSTIVAEAMGLMTYSLTELADLLDDTAAAEEEVRAALMESGDALIDRLAPAARDIREGMQRIAAAVRSLPKEPPSSNTGVTGSGDSPQRDAA